MREMVRRVGDKATVALVHLAMIVSDPAGIGATTPH